MAAKSNRPALTPAQIRLLRLASLASLSVAATLMVLKTWAWRATESVAMLGSLADSTLDLLASAVTFFALRFALLPADREHRFGHGKSEGIAGLFQALIVSGSAAYVGFEAISRLLEPQPLTRPAVGMVVIGVSLVLTLSLVFFQNRVVERTGSLAISADSVHYRADTLTNLGVLAGILAADQFAWYIADPLIGLGIAAVVLASVRRIAVDSINVLLDRELPGQTRERIERIAETHPDVLGVHDIRTRSAGAMQFIQLHLELDPGLTLVEVHEISEAVERDVRSAFPLAEVLIHADPYGLREPRDPF